MGTHFVSLRQLADLRKAGAPSHSASTRRSSVSGDGAEGPEDSTGSLPGTGLSAGSAGCADGVAWAKDPCEPARSGAEASPFETNPVMGRFMLALVYRLAGIEQQLADLKADLCGGSRPASLSGVEGVGPVAEADSGKSKGPAGKSELLEQMFRHNVLLRRMRSDRPTGNDPESI